MFYRPSIDPHGLPRDPYKALLAPRPIAWVSTLDADGRANLAPFSYFNGVADSPPIVMFAPHGAKVGRDEGKDTLANVLATGEFVVNLVGWDLRDAMNVTSGPYPPGQDEFDIAGLEKAPCQVVARSELR
jgi:flavin reductase (DIM6/NTAB) family NADH-FMN oxidoreductase RutF